MGLGGRGPARLVHVESMNPAADLFTNVLCSPMFESHASMGFGFKRRSRVP